MAKVELSGSMQRRSRRRLCSKLVKRAPVRFEIVERIAEVDSALRKPLIGSLYGRPPAPPRAKSLGHSLGESHHSTATPGDRSQWERIVLATDVELHIRRPLSRATPAVSLSSRRVEIAFNGTPA